MSKNLRPRAKYQHLFDGEVPVLTEKLMIDISTKVISNLVYARPGTGQYPPKIKIADSELALIRSPKILGVHLDTFFSFNNHCVQVANRVIKRNNVLKVLAGTNWGQQKETLLMTALGRLIANYAAPV